MASNTAAWLVAAKARPFEIKAAPMGTPGEGQILVKNHAIAINPVNGKIQALALFPLNYPVILGEDVAGEVVAVGPDVTRFKKEDRVMGIAAGTATKREEDKAFQAYTILQTNLASEIPNTVSFERAVVLPLGVATAAAGLFQDDFLNLQLPTEPAQKLAGNILLVWGGASSVGGNAIQLAVAAGYEVVTTASSKNFEHVKKLGASHVFDYSSPTVISDIVEICKGRRMAGAFDAIGGSALEATIEVLQRSKGTKFVATVLPRFASPPEGIIAKQVQAFSIMKTYVGKAIFEDFLPHALKANVFSLAPEPLIAGKGLESLQAGVDLQSKGTSAQKVVVLL